MGQKNQYLDKFVPTLYRKTALDIMIYMFIDTQRFTIPGISIENSAKAFIVRFGIDEGDLSIDKVLITYYRLQKELIYEKRTA